MTQWLPILAIATPIVVAALGTLGVVWGKRLTKRTAAATASEIEARTTASQVATAHNLLEDVKALYAEERTERREDKARFEVEIDGLKRKQAATDHKLMTLIGELILHRPWDTAAFNALTAKGIDFPPPPPIDAVSDEEDRFGPPRPDFGSHTH
jgi:hypothetical protein